MKKKVRKIIKGNVTLSKMAENFSKLKSRNKMSEYHKYLFSNVVEGSLKVTVNNIPGIFEIDARSHILKRILKSKEYEPDITKLLLEKIDPNYDAVNVGANIGLFTNFLASNIDEYHKVLAIEPTPNAYKLLKNNVERNGNREKVIIFNGIATDLVGNYQISVISGKEEYSSVGKITHHSVIKEEFETINVIGDTIDNLTNKHKLNPRIILIDVEGFEFQVLKGMNQTIKKHLPIIVSELDDKLLASKNTNSRKIIGYIESFGYSVTDIDNDYPEFPFTGNIIAIPKDKIN